MNLRVNVFKYTIYLWYILPDSYRFKEMYSCGEDEYVLNTVRTSPLKVGE